MARSTLGTDEAPGPERQAYADRLKGLVDTAAMGGGRILMELSGAAHEVRAALEVWLFELAEKEPLGPRFASFVGKMPGLFGRLCAVLASLEPTGFGHIISEQVASHAAFLIKHSVIPHAARVYLTMGDGDASAEAMQAIAGFILVKKTSRVLVSDLTTGVWQCRKRSLADVTKILAPLVAGGWLNPEMDTPNNRAWLVNPIVHARFGDRAASETARRAARSALLRGGQEEENGN